MPNLQIKVTERRLDEELALVTRCGNSGGSNSGGQGSGGGGKCGGSRATPLRQEG